MVQRRLGFNEAAANGRGNLHPGFICCNFVLQASMRPRRMAAEIFYRTLLRNRRLSCFNEAAANGRGNHGMIQLLVLELSRFNEAAANGRGNRRWPRRARPRCSRFNEAAANGRGNLVGARQCRTLIVKASMRPRRMAAEIIVNRVPVRGGHGASMRPRRMAAEITHLVVPPSLEYEGFNEAAANGRGNRESACNPPGVDGGLQ